MADFGHNGGPPVVERAGNWFAVSREIFTHAVVGIGDREYTELEAWLSMLAMAEYDERRVMNKGVMIVLDPGQLMAAHAYLSKRWKWSTDKVRWFLKRLEREAMITRYCAKHDANRNTNQIQVITICNYGKFNNVETPEHQANYQPEHQANTKPTPSAHQANTKNLTTKPSNHLTITASLPPQRDFEVDGLAGLNGATSAILDDVEKWMNGGDRRSAAMWLTNAVRIYGDDVVKSAWMKLGTDMADGQLISSPIRTFSAIADRMAKERKSGSHQSRGGQESTVSALFRVAKNIDHKRNGDAS